MTLVLRACFRCHTPLTDAASQEVGVGPVCRKLDNAVLARQIPSNMPKAIAAFAELDGSTLPAETVGTIMAISEAINSPNAPTVLDWRAEIKKIEWVLSFGGTSAQNSKVFVSVTRALGYVTLANLWTGVGTSGHGSGMLFCDGRAYFHGPKCKGGQNAIRLISGRRFHAVGTVAGLPASAAWSVPASQAGLLARAAQEYWALVDVATVAETVEKALAWVADHPVAPVVPAPPFPSLGIQEGPKGKAVAFAEDDGKIIRATTPYKGPFIADLKEAFPREERQWDPIMKQWLFLPLIIFKAIPMN